VEDIKPKRRTWARHVLHYFPRRNPFLLAFGEMQLAKLKRPLKARSNQTSVEANPARAARAQMTRAQREIRPIVRTRCKRISRQRGARSEMWTCSGGCRRYTRRSFRWGRSAARFETGFSGGRDGQRFGRRFLGAADVVTVMAIASSIERMRTHSTFVVRAGTNEIRRWRSERSSFVHCGD